MERKLSEFKESDKSLKRELGSIENPICYLCLIGSVVTFWSLT